MLGTILQGETMVSSHSRVVGVGPIIDGRPSILGDVLPVSLACGHSFHGNPTMFYPIGEWVRCFDCLDRDGWAGAAIQAHDENHSPDCGCLDALDLLDTPMGLEDDRAGEDA